MQNKIKCYRCGKPSNVLFKKEIKMLIPESSKPNYKIYIVIDSLVCKDCINKI